MKNRWALSVLLTVILTSPTFADTAAPRVVKTTPVSYQTYQHPIHRVGILSNKVQQSLSFKTSGYVKRFAVDEGEWVNKGDIIAELDTTEAQARLTQAASRYRNALKQLKRAQRLVTDKLMTEAQLNDAETEVDVARQNQKIAAFDLENSVIKAPASGLILSRNIEEKQYVTPAVSVFTQSNVDAGFVFRVGLVDKDVVRVKHKDNATIRFDAYPGIEFPATVSEIAATASPQTGLFEVELRLVPTSLTLIEGLVGHASVLPSQTENVAILPANAIVTADERHASIYVVDDENTVHEKRIDIAFLLSGDIATREGIQSGERVITEGAAFVKPGDHVNVSK